MRRRVERRHDPPPWSPPRVSWRSKPGRRRPRLRRETIAPSRRKLPPPRRLTRPRRTSRPRPPRPPTAPRPLLVPLLAPGGRTRVDREDPSQKSQELPVVAPPPMDRAAHRRGGAILSGNRRRRGHRPRAREMRLVEKLLEMDDRNFHCWGYSASSLVDRAARLRRGRSWRSPRGRSRPTSATIRRGITGARFFPAGARRAQRRRRGRAFSRGRVCCRRRRWTRSTSSCSRRSSPSRRIRAGGCITGGSRDRPRADEPGWGRGRSGTVFFGTGMETFPSPSPSPETWRRRWIERRRCAARSSRWSRAAGGPWRPWRDSARRPERTRGRKRVASASRSSKD